MHALGLIQYDKTYDHTENKNWVNKPDFLRTRFPLTKPIACISTNRNVFYYYKFHTRTIELVMLSSNSGKKHEICYFLFYHEPQLSQRLMIVSSISQVDGEDLNKMALDSSGQALFLQQPVVCMGTSFCFSVVLQLGTLFVRLPKWGLL